MSKDFDLSSPYPDERDADGGKERDFVDDGRDDDEDYDFTTSKSSTGGGEGKSSEEKSPDRK